MCHQSRQIATLTAAEHVASVIQLAVTFVMGGGVGKCGGGGDGGGSGGGGGAVSLVSGRRTWPCHIDFVERSVHSFGRLWCVGAGVFGRRVGRSGTIF